MRIQNVIDEYLGNKKISEVQESIIELVETEMQPRCMCVGLILLWAFSKNPKEFPSILSLVIELHKAKSVSAKDVEEGYIL